LFILDFNTVFS